MELRLDDLLAGGLLRFALDVDSIHRVSTAAVLVHLGGSESLALLTFEEEVESLLLVGDGRGGQTLHVDLALGVVLDRDAATISWVFREQIVKLLVIDLQVTYGDDDLLLGVRADLLEHLVDSSWDDSSVLEVWSSAIHGESFSCTSLTVAHNGPVKAVDHGLDDILRAI